MERIAAAGYAGACVDPNESEIPDCLALKPTFERLGLKCMVNAFPHNVDSMRPLLDMAAEMNATQVNVIGGVMFFSEFLHNRFYIVFRSNGINRSIEFALTVLI